MGAGSSKEVVLPVAPQASSTLAASQAEAAAEHERRAREAASAYREA